MECGIKRQIVPPPRLRCSIEISTTKESTLHPPRVSKDDHRLTMELAEHGLSRRICRCLAPWFIPSLGAVVLFVLWLSGRVLGSTHFPDGTKVTLLRYTHGTVHELGRQDLRKRFKWIPVGFWKAIHYTPRFHAIRREGEPCTVLWMRVEWKPERQEPLPSDLQVQSVEPDGTAYPWDLMGVYKSGANELILPYRARALRPAGGSLKVRVVEQVTQRENMGGDFKKRNANRRPPEHQMTNLLALPNPVKGRPSQVDPLPLPQSLESNGLQAMLQSIQTKPLADGEFGVDARFQLLWHGAEELNAFRCYYSISTPEGEAAPHRRWGAFVDPMPGHTQLASGMPNAPMRGHRAWLLNLHVISTASFSELASERGIPLFAAPVAAKSSGGKGEPPTVSPEASEAGFGIIDIWPPRGLRLVVHRMPERWFPTDWKRSDPLPFVVVAEANGKRVSLRESSTGGGYGKYGLGSYDFGVPQTPEQLANWTTPMQSLTPGERTGTPEAFEYFLIPRRYWKFTFPLAPVEPPRR
jgi:hypothetical protein